MESPPNKEVTAIGRLSKATHNSLVFSSVLGPSLYFTKPCFEGDEPSEVEITLKWQPNHNHSPNKEKTDGETEQRT